MCAIVSVIVIIGIVTCLVQQNPLFLHSSGVLRCIVIPVVKRGLKILHVLFHAFQASTSFLICIIGLHFFYQPLEQHQIFYCMHTWTKSTLVMLCYPGKLLLKTSKIYYSFLLNVTPLRHAKIALLFMASC
jgi:hypothetical protein